MAIMLTKDEVKDFLESKVWKAFMEIALERKRGLEESCIDIKLDSAEKAALELAKLHGKIEQLCLLLSVDEQVFSENIILIGNEKED